MVSVVSDPDRETGGRSIFMWCVLQVNSFHLGIFSVLLVLEANFMLNPFSRDCLSIGLW